MSLSEMTMRFRSRECAGLYDGNNTYALAYIHVAYNYLSKGPV